MKHLKLFFWAAFCVAIGLAGGMVQRDALHDWYPFLVKPYLTPPDGVFPVVWTILYILMGISIGLVRRHALSERKTITGIFLAQLAVNFLWSVAFFYGRSPVAGLGVLSALLLLLLWYVWKSWPVSRPGVYLFIPYIIWCGFAWYLNYFILRHN